MADPGAVTMVSAAVSVGPYLAHYGYLAVLLGVTLESAGVPVPGETVLLAAGALAARGAMNVWVVAALGALAGIVGDNFGYLVGRYGGRRVISWLEGRALPHRSLDRMDHFFARWGPFSLIVARFVTGVRVVAAIAAGASGMSWTTFLPYNAAGALLWSSAVTAVGYMGGELSKLVHPGGVLLDRVAIAVGIVGLAVLIAFALRGRLPREMWRPDPGERDTAARRRSHSRRR